MCGIFAYKGTRTNASEIVINGLKKLEYRGYDSWGVAQKTNSHIEVHKQIGKIGDLDELNELYNAARQHKSSLAIGHSRWATHGGVTQANAHPHFNEDKSIVVAHNGIIENFLELREELKSEGFTFHTETDTETVVYLLEKYCRELSLEEAFKKTISRLEGRYALLIMKKDENVVMAARRGSPLIVGVGEHEFFIASDIPAFLEYTRNVMYLDDNQMVIIEDNGPRFVDLLTNHPIEKRLVEIDWEVESAEKGEFPHFMIKEIMEQKETISRAINQNEEEILRIAEEIKNAYGTFLIGCGTAGKVCLAASYIFSEVAKRHVNVVFGSEFPCHKHFLKEKSLVIAVSQSGETAATLEALEVAKQKGAKVLSIINVEGSSMDRISDFSLHIKAGPEKAVASTKATTAQMAILTLLAYACDGRLDEGKQLLINTASQINDMLNPRYEEHIQELAQKIQNNESMYVIGRSLNYPMALEAAIKLQEVSYIHAEGFAGGELKHGPIALISEGTPVIALVANDECNKEIISNAMEVKARGAYVIGVSPENHEVFDFWIKVPDVGETAPIVNIIPIQILAYQLAVLRQNDPDMPRNLAKSVTVK